MPKPIQQPKCEHIKNDGEECQASLMSGSKYCYFHSPEISPEERKISQKRGGENRKIILSSPLDPITLQKPKDVVLLLSETINKVRTGEMDIKIANCIGVLSGHLTKALELTEVEERVEVIEKAVLKKKTFNNS